MNTERCPSGRRCLTRNQVWLIATVGSNPTLSAISQWSPAACCRVFLHFVHAQPSCVHKKRLRHQVQRLMVQPLLPAIILLLWQLPCHRNSHIPGIHDAAFSAHGTAGKPCSRERSVSSWRGADRDGPWMFYALVLPFDVHLRVRESFSEIHAMGWCWWITFTWIMWFWHIYLW